MWSTRRAKATCDESRVLMRCACVRDAHVTYQQSRQNNISESYQGEITGALGEPQGDLCARLVQRIRNKMRVKMYKNFDGDVELGRYSDHDIRAKNTAKR